MIKQRYNDPSIGQAFESIASLFAPMSGSDLAGYAAADANRQKALAQAQQTGLIDLYVRTGNERAAIAGRAFAPNQSMEAVQLGDATQRYGYDRSYQSSTENNARDNATAQRGQDLDLEGLVYGHDRAYQSSTENNVRDNDRQRQTAAMDILGQPLNPGQQVRAIDNDVWSAFGLPDMPDVPEYRNDRADPSRIPSIKSVRLPDGRITGASESPEGFIEAASGQPLPAGTIPFSANATGEADAMGLGRTPQSRIQMDLLEVEAAKATASRLMPLLKQNPGSLGAVGWLQGTAQDAIATGGEIGQLFGNGYNEVFSDIQNGAADAGLIGQDGALNPALPRIDFLKNLFVYQIAKIQTGERMSNEAVRQWRRSMGMDGVFSNMFRGTNALDEAVGMLNTRETTLRRSLEQNGIVSSGPAPGLADIGQTGATVPAPAPGRIRYDANGNRIE